VETHEADQPIRVGGPERLTASSREQPDGVDMKLGMLLVVSVAVLLPSRSEGRTVSECELKEKLGEAITLPGRLQRFKEKILAIVICEVKRRSRLETGLVRVLGKRGTTTTLSAPRVDETTSEPTTTGTTTTEPTTTEPTTTEPTTTEPTTTEPTTTEPTTTEPTTTEPTTTEPTTTEPTTIGTTTTEPIDPEAGGARRKRDADAGSHESNSREMDVSMEEVMKEVEGESDEDLGQDDDMMGDEDEESDEEDIAEGGERKKLRPHLPRPRNKKSLGFYGLFQLADSFFCNSGYRWSKNKCNAPCEAFTDDDITDDVACFVETHYWWILLKKASRSCYHTNNLFSECEGAAAR
ncbi:putative ataxin-2 -like, partial [Scophthalmus maximus]